MNRHSHWKTHFVPVLSLATAMSITTSVCDAGWLDKAKAKIEVPKAPRIALPRPPKIEFPKVPPVFRPTSPKINLPQVSNIALPKPPKLEFPKIPKLDVPKVPRIAIPQIHPPKLPMVSVPFGLPKSVRETVTRPHVPELPKLKLPLPTKLPSVPKLNVNFPNLPKVGLPQAPKLPAIRLPQNVKLPSVKLPGMSGVTRPSPGPLTRISTKDLLFVPKQLNPRELRYEAGEAWNRGVRDPWVNKVFQTTIDTIFGPFAKAGQKTIDSESRAKEKFDRDLDKKWREFTQQFEERTYQAILRQTQRMQVAVPDEYSRRAAANLRAQLFGETSPTAAEWQTLRRDFEHVLSSQLTQAAQQYAVDQYVIANRRIGRGGIEALILERAETYRGISRSHAVIPTTAIDLVTVSRPPLRAVPSGCSGKK